MIVIYLVAGWVAGILAAAQLRLPTPVWLVLFPIPLGYLALFWRNPLLRTWHVVLIFFLLGALRYQLALPGALDRQLAQFNEQGTASLIGLVSDAPDVRDNQTLLRVEVSKIQTAGNWREVGGSALVSVPRDTPVQYGDEVQVDGAPGTPPDGADFSYRDYLARQGIFTLIRNARLYVISSSHGDPFWTALYQIGDRAQAAINQLLPEPSASLLTGILLGNAHGIPPGVRAAFNDTNTAHIIAISGYNIAVLVAVLAFLFRRPADALRRRAFADLSRPPSRVLSLFTAALPTLSILLLLVLYTLLVGASASVVRACIMGALAVIALPLGRRAWALNSLAIAALLMSLANPYVLWDVGFQLSFMATLGLLVFAPRLEEFVSARLEPRVDETQARQLLDLIRDAFIITAAAFLATAPLLVAYFHRLSLIGFVTNFLILPAQPPIMLLGGAATFLQLLANGLSGIPSVSLIPGALAQVLAWGAYIFLQYTILVVQTSAAVPFGSFDVGQIDWTLVLFAYAILFALLWLGLKRTAQIVLARAWLPISLFAVAVILVWTSALAAPPTQTQLTFLAASRGDATLIRTADDHRLLINGTAEPSTLLGFLGSQFLPWDRRLDLVIATHLDDDNLGSLNAILERYTVGQVLIPPTPAHPGVGWQHWQELVQARAIPASTATLGTTLRAGDVTTEVLYPDVAAPTTNAVLRLTINNQTFLLAPVLTQADRTALLDAEMPLQATTAVLPNQAEQEFLARVAPTTVIFFAGSTPRNQPDAATLKLLAGKTVLRTDERGNIEVKFEGEEMKVQAQR